MIAPWYTRSADLHCDFGVNSLATKIASPRDLRLRRIRRRLYVNFENPLWLKYIVYMYEPNIWCEASKSKDDYVYFIGGTQTENTQEGQ